MDDVNDIRVESEEVGEETTPIGGAEVGRLEKALQEEGGEHLWEEEEEGEGV